MGMLSRRWQENKKPAQGGLREFTAVFRLNYLNISKHGAYCQATCTPVSAHSATAARTRMMACRVVFNSPGYLSHTDAPVTRDRQGTCAGQSRNVTTCHADSHVTIHAMSRAGHAGQAPDYLDPALTDSGQPFAAKPCLKRHSGISGELAVKVRGHGAKLRGR